MLALLAAGAALSLSPARAALALLAGAVVWTGVAKVLADRGIDDLRSEEAPGDPASELLVGDQLPVDVAALRP